MFCSVSAHIWWRVVVGDQFQHNIVTIRDFQFLPSFGWFFYAQNAPKTVILPESQKIEPRGPANPSVPVGMWSQPDFGPYPPLATAPGPVRRLQLAETRIFRLAKSLNSRPILRGGGTYLPRGEN